MGHIDAGMDAVAWGRFEEVTWRCFLPYAFSFGTPRGRAFLIGWLGGFIMLDWRILDD